ncbi:MAG: MopE-related protein [Myxococcota bacterium]
MRSQGPVAWWFMLTASLLVACSSAEGTGQQAGEGADVGASATDTLSVQDAVAAASDVSAPGDDVGGASLDVDEEAGDLDGAPESDTTGSPGDVEGGGGADAAGDAVDGTAGDDAGAQDAVTDDEDSDESDDVTVDEDTDDKDTDDEGDASPEGDTGDEDASAEDDAAAADAMLEVDSASDVMEEDAEVDSGPVVCADFDDDGFCVPEDCNDSEEGINPDAEEFCGDGIDNDCDSLTDEDCDDVPTVIDETTCEGAAAALTSAGCLFAPIVGNDTSNVFKGPLPWAVIAANANDTPTDVTLYYPDGEVVDSVVIEGGDLHIFELDGPTNALWEQEQETGVTSKVFRLEATRPIVAYQFQPYSSSQSATADAALLLPRHAWGNNYLLLNHKGTGATWVTIIALDDGVVARVRMPEVMNNQTKAGGGIPALGPSDVHLIPLNAGESARIWASSSVDMSGMGIFTGNKDVAVIVGSPGTNLPGPNVVGYNDYLEEQLPPRTAWGTEVAVVKFRPITNESDVYRVMADKNGTTVNITGDFEAQYSLDEGEFAEFQSAGSFVVEGSDAILVAHGMVSAKVSTGTPDPVEWPGWYEGTSNCGASGTLTADNMGDPAVSFVTPSAQYRNNYVFLTPYTYAWDVLTIIVPEWAWDTVLVDGLPLPAPTVLAGSSDLWFARFLVADGAHHVESPLVGVGIEVHGYDCRLSYAYAGGLSLGAINEPPPVDELPDP